MNPQFPNPQIGQQPVQAPNQPAATRRQPTVPVRRRRRSPGMVAPPPPRPARSAARRSRMPIRRRQPPSRRPDRSLDGSRRRHERRHRRCDAQARSDSPDALRMLKAALINREVERGRALDDAESRQVVAALVKQRKDSIEQFTNGGRQDLADKEAAEIRVLEAYLPPPADPAVVEQAVIERHRRNRRDVAEGHGPRDEGGDGEARGPERGRQGRQRARAPEAGGRLNFFRDRPSKPSRRRTASHPSSFRPLPLCGGGLFLCATLANADETGHSVRSRHRPPRRAKGSRVTRASPASPRWRAASSASRATRCSPRSSAPATRWTRSSSRSAIPNLVRDLFAEGAMSAAFVPTFTRQLTLERQGRRVAARQQRAERAAARRPARSSSLGIVFARPLVDAVRRRLRARSRQARADDSADARDAAVSDDGGGRGGGDGHAELAASLLRARARRRRCSTSRRSSARSSSCR